MDTSGRHVVTLTEFLYRFSKEELICRPKVYPLSGAMRKPHDYVFINRKNKYKYSSMILQNISSAKQTKVHSDYSTKCFSQTSVFLGFLIIEGASYVIPVLIKGT